MNEGQEEGMGQGTGKRDAFGGLVLQHFLQQIKKQMVLCSVRQQVVLKNTDEVKKHRSTRGSCFKKLRPASAHPQRLALSCNVASGLGALVPVQTPTAKILLLSEKRSFVG